MKYIIRWLPYFPRESTPWLAINANHQINYRFWLSSPMLSASFIIVIIRCRGCLLRMFPHTETNHSIPLQLHNSTERVEYIFVSFHLCLWFAFSLFAFLSLRGGWPNGLSRDRFCPRADWIEYNAVESIIGSWAAALACHRHSPFSRKYALNGASRGNSGITGSSVQCVQCASNTNESFIQ